ncbi:MAG: PKD domain-containing protein, partial [Synergistaceae bacterium]|nr:PKD domain-containing protein [Synergistaceae bacterium]
EPGVYTVKLSVSGLGGTDVETKTGYITVYDPAQAEFSATPLTGVAPLEVVFTNLSSGDYDSFTWDFGDGGNSSLQNPTHIYAEPGVYTVKLSVSGLGGTDVETKTGYITVYDPAQADFTATPLTGVAPLSVQFTNLSTGEFDTQTWDFGDGGNSSLQNPSHNYTEAGIYTVTLTIDGPGGSDVETKTGYITVYDPAQADFTATPLTGVAPLEVDFTNLSSGDYDSFTWDFGDGGNSSLQNPTHIYTEPGVYTVKLSVSGLGGTDVETKTGYITVYDSAQANFSATPLTGVAPLSVQFTNLSTGEFDTQTWDFGDGGNSSLQNSSHIYTEAGVYTVTLTIDGPGGSDVETKTGYITVYDPAQADFTATPLTGVAPLEVDFTNLSSGDYDSFTWDFGDGNSSTEFEPTHTYTSAGVYSVSLTIEGPGGTATEKKVGYITVYEVVVANFSASPMIGQPILSVEFTNLSTGSYETIKWDFGDGTFSNEINPIHSYSAIGTYQITISVEGPGGSDTFQREIIVIPYANYLPLIVR